MPLTDPLIPQVFTHLSVTSWLGIFLLAMLADLFIGKLVAGKIPDLSTLMSPFSAAVARKLDKANRTPRALWVRGTLVCCLFLPLSTFIGWYANGLLVLGIYGEILCIFLLLPNLKATRKVAALHASETLLAEPTGKGQNDNFKSARADLAQAVTTIAPRLLTLALLFSLTGFAGLLPFIWLETLVNAGERTRSGGLESPFFNIPGFFYELVSFLPALFASIMLAIAHFFLGGTNLKVFSALLPTATIGPVSRYFPLKVISEGLGLSLEADIGCEAKTRKAFDRSPRWITAEHGRARISAADLRKAALILVITLVLYLLAGSMIFTALLLR